uniref:Sarcosine oxidasee (formaldehyde-forming) n=1 Tax=Parastrongyloides trichosuri TaxID=131310 RepID=A0A0N4ZWG4_PARTI
MIFDVIVIGAGIMGFSSAYQAAKRGKKVLLIEQFSLFHNNGSSHGASRIIRLCHTDKIYVNMAKRSFELWDEMMNDDDNREELYTSCGLLWLGDKNGTTERVKWLKKINAEYEIMEGKEINARYPHLKYDEDGWYGVLDKKGGVIYADKCLKVSERLIKKFNGKIKDKTKIVEIIPGDIVKIITDNGEMFETKKLIITVGAWLNKLLPEIQLQSTPLLVSVNYWKIKKEYENIFEKYFSPKNNSPTIIATKDNEEVFMIPGVDFKNMIKFGVHNGDVFDIDSSHIDRKIPAWMAKESGKHISKHLPFIESSKPEKIISCVYQMTKDINFILDRHPMYSNIAIGSGFSGTGFKFGSVVGEILNQLIDGEEIKCCDMNYFSATRKIDTNLSCKI